VAAHVGDASQLQQALDGAVLAVLPVEHGKDHVDPLPDHVVPLEGEQALAPDGGDGGGAVGGVIPPGAGGQLGPVRAPKEDPVALLGDAHGVDMVFFRVQMVQHGLRGAQRDLVLRRHAAEQDADVELFHACNPHMQERFVDPRISGI